MKRLLRIFVAAAAALFFFSWKALAVTVVSYYICTGLGISMGYHRLHTHRSYRVPLWLEHFFALCGALTLEGDRRALDRFVSLFRFPPSGAVAIRG